MSQSAFKCLEIYRSALCLESVAVLQQTKYMV